MPEIKPNPKESAALEELSKAVESDPKLAERLLTDSHTVLKEYELNSLAESLDDPFTLELRMDQGKMRRKQGREQEEDWFHHHFDGHGHHKDGVGHADSGAWHVDF